MDYQFDQIYDCVTIDSIWILFTTFILHSVKEVDWNSTFHSYVFDDVRNKSLLTWMFWLWQMKIINDVYFQSYLATSYLVSSKFTTCQHAFRSCSCCFSASWLFLFIMHTSIALLFPLGPHNLNTNCLT